MELRRLNCIYKSGVDRNGRVVVVCNLAPVIAARTEHHHILLHLVELLDPIVTQRFTIIYIHADLPGDYRPSYKWLKARPDLALICVL